MRSEPLTIDDKRFLINRLIKQAPTGTLVREFFKNADENAALAPEGERKILIQPVMIDGVRKLSFWNTGVGMDDAELKKATNLSSSINKTMGLEQNFGIGAKVTAFRVGKTTCYAISKRLADDWTGDDLDRATSPESLSMAADDYKQSLKMAKKWAADFMKAASVNNEDAA